MSQQMETKEIISIVFHHILLCSPLEGLEVGTCVGLDVGADERTLE
jgi:hypothetical protein